MKYLQILGAQRQRLGPVFYNWLQTELQENLNFVLMFSMFLMIATKLEEEVGPFQLGVSKKNNF